MGLYAFIRLKGAEGNARTGYLVPRMYQLVTCWSVLKQFGFSYIKERLRGNTIWWVSNEEDFLNALNTLNKLKKTRTFDYDICILPSRGAQ